MAKKKDKVSVNLGKKVAVVKANLQKTADEEVEKIFDHYKADIADKIMKQINSKIDSNDPVERKEAQELLKLMGAKLYRNKDSEPRQSETRAQVSDQAFEAISAVLANQNKIIKLASAKEVKIDE